jgi:hypothetical protein
VLQTIVQDNLTILSVIVNNSMIKAFIRLNKVEGPQARFIQFLRKLASCNGHRISQNQDRLLAYLLSSRNCSKSVELNRRDLIVETWEDDRDRRKYVSGWDMRTINKLLGSTSRSSVDSAGGVEGWPEDEHGRSESFAVCIFNEYNARVTPKMSKYRVLAPSIAKCASMRRIDPHPTPSDPTGVEGNVYFEVSSRAELQVFEAVLRDGTAHVDRGYEYLGKRAYQRGFGTLIVLWNALQTQPSDNEILTAFPKIDDLFCCRRYPLSRDRYERSDHHQYLSRLAEIHRLGGGEGMADWQMTWVRLEDLVWVLEPDLLVETTADIGIDESVNAEQEPLFRWVMQMRTHVSASKAGKDADHVKVDLDSPHVTNSTNPIFTGRGSVGMQGLDVLVDASESWAEVEHGLSDAQKEAFDKQVSVARYYEEQLLLFAEMCVDRNYIVIEELEKMFPFTQVFNGMQNPHLPLCIRMAFCRLMCSLWVDRHPHHVIQAPAPIRLFSQMNLDVVLGIADKARRRPLPHFLLDEHDPCRDRPEAFYSLNDMRKMRLLKYFIQDVMLQVGSQTIGNQPRNRFVLSVLQLLHKLVRFGFFATAEDIRNFLILPLVHILDGRSDKYSDDMVQMQGRSSSVGRSSLSSIDASMAGAGGKLSGASNEDASLGRWQLNEFTKPVIECKVNILRILVQVTDLRLDYRLSKLFHGFRIMLEAATGTAASIKKQVQALQAPVDDGGSQLFHHPSFSWLRKRLRQRAESQLQQSSASSTAGDDAEQEYEWHQDAPKLFEALFEQIFQLKRKKGTSSGSGGGGAQTKHLPFHQRPSAGHHQQPLSLDIEAITEELEHVPFVTMILDLLMYESFDLFHASFSLLLRHYSQRRSLLRALFSSHVLVSDDDVDQHKKIRGHLMEVRKGLNSFNQWAMAQEQKRNESMARLLAEIHALTDFACGGLDQQDLLRELGVHAIILRAFRIPPRQVDYANRNAAPAAEPGLKSEKDNDEHSRQKDRAAHYNKLLRAVKNQCCKLMSAFVYGNPRNQQLMYEDLSSITMLTHSKPHTEAQAPIHMSSGTNGGILDTNPMVMVMAALGDIFRMNFDLASQIPQELFDRFAGCIEHGT